MSKIVIDVLFLFSCFHASVADTLPKFDSDTTISGIETWPNATNLTYGFMVKITSSLSSTGCGSSNRFSVKYGDFQDQTLSILLAAMMANKKSESMSMSVLIDLLSIELK